MSMPLKEMNDVLKNLNSELSKKNAGFNFNLFDLSNPTKKEDKSENAPELKPEPLGFLRDVYAMNEDQMDLALRFARIENVKFEKNKNEKGGGVKRRA